MATKEITKTIEEEKKVKIKLPRVRGAQEDVFVGVNGRTWLIQRGVEVEVPECVAVCLEESETAQAEADKFMNAVVK